MRNLYWLSFEGAFSVEITHILCQNMIRTYVEVDNVYGLLYKR